jgi:hypothetical protein
MAKQDAIVVHGAARSQRKRKIIAVNSGKGGTGKSTVTLALVDHLRRLGREVIVVEMDTSNADVGKCFHPANMPTGIGPPRVVPMDFEQNEAWMDLVDLCVENPDDFIVLNMKGGNVKEVAAYGRKLNDALTEARQEVICIWVLNLYRDSVLAMRAFYKVMPMARMYAFLNEVWGSRGDFDEYHRDPIKLAIEEDKAVPDDEARRQASGERDNDGGIVAKAEDDDEDEGFVDDDGLKRTLVFPRVANRILKQFFNKRRSVEAQLARKRIRYPEKIEIQSWREATSKVFEEVLK